jgi:hypothetical protein
MTSKQSTESDLANPIPAQSADLIVRAALCAVNCGAALEVGDLIAATEHLGNLRESIARLERIGAGDRHDVCLLRSHEVRLSERLFTGQFSIASGIPSAGANSAG